MVHLTQTARSISARDMVWIIKKPYQLVKVTLRFPMLYGFSEVPTNCSGGAVETTVVLVSL